MAIFRGVGGSGESSDNSFLDAVTAQANAASASATSAANSATSALNTELTSASFNTSDGVLTLTKQDGDTVTADLDGRFLTQAIVEGKADLTGATFTGNVNFGDSIKATFGASNDLQIYHNGMSSIIQDVGEGDLVLLGTDFLVGNGTGAQTYIRAAENAEVQLTYNGATKFKTTDIGIDVTGAVFADGLTSEIAASGARAILATFSNFASLAAGAQATIQLKNAGQSAFITGESVAANSGMDIVFSSNDSTNTETNKMRLAENGDISFYEDTGTTPKLFWDASAERLGIGTTSPSAQLHVKNNDAGFEVDVDVQVTDGVRLLAYDRNTSTDRNMQYRANQHLFNIGASEKMRIDSSGNVGIGTTSPNRLLTVESSSVGLAEFESTNSTSKVYFKDSGTTNTYSVAVGSVGDGMAFYASSGGAERMRIDTSGRVGIGTSSPSQALDVDGTVKASNLDISTTGSVTTNIATGINDSNATDVKVVNIGTGYGSGFFAGDSTTINMGSQSSSAKNIFNIGSGVTTTNKEDTINLKGNVTVDGTLNGGTYERTVRTRFQRRAYSSVNALTYLTTSYTQVGASLRINSGATTAVENILDLNVTLQFSDINSTNDGMFAVTVDAPNPSNETTVNLGTVTSSAQGTFQVTGDFTKHFSPYCGMSTNSDGSNSFTFVQFEGWHYDPVTDKTVVFYNPFQSNVPSLGDTVYLHPFDWETQGTEIYGEEYPIEAYNASGTVHQNQFHQIYLGYYKPERTFKLKFKEQTASENIAVTRVAGSYSQIIGS